jgi:hypothetical protein
MGSSTGRTEEPRPFPFLTTYDPRVYARRLTGAIAAPTIAYKCVAQLPEAEFRDWLCETEDEYQIDCISLVGRATSAGRDAGTPLLRAIQIASEYPGLTVGGVVIPERHTVERSESARLIQKSQAGCSFFISQAVYSPDAVIRLCRDYARDCEAAGISPRRIILTFTPCGRPQTLGFMKWLGVTIPAETEAAILSAEDPLAASIQICAENLRRILDSGVGDSVPLGTKAEIVGSVELLKTLQDVIAGYR